MRGSRSITLLLLVGTIPCAVRADVELAAMMAIGSQRRFVVRDEQGTSGWLTVGQSFHGCELLSYDPTHDVLTVRRLGQLQQLALVGSHVMTSAPTIADELVACGVTPADLVVRDTAPVRITLVIERSAAPLAQRVINLRFDNGADHAGVAFGPAGPEALRRSFVPEAVRDVITDNDIAAINAHLATVRAKLRNAP